MSDLYQKIRLQVEKINNVLAQLDKPEGLVPMYLNPHTGKWGSREWLLFNFICFFCFYASVPDIGELEIFVLWKMIVTETLRDVYVLKS